MLTQTRAAETQELSGLGASYLYEKGESLLHPYEETGLGFYQYRSDMGFFGSLSNNEKTMAVIAAVAAVGWWFTRKKR